jgi:hypothetical protein
MKIELETTDDDRTMMVKITNKLRAITYTTEFLRINESRQDAAVLDIPMLSKYEWDMLDEIVKIVSNALNRHLPEEQEGITEILPFDLKGIYTLSRARVFGVKVTGICSTDFDVNEANGVVTVKSIGQPRDIAFKYGFKSFPRW